MPLPSPPLPFLQTTPPNFNRQAYHNLPYRFNIQPSLSLDFIMPPISCRQSASRPVGQPASQPAIQLTRQHDELSRSLYIPSPMHLLPGGAITRGARRCPPPAAGALLMLLLLLYTVFVVAVVAEVLLIVV